MRKLLRILALFVACSCVFCGEGFHYRLSNGALVYPGVIVEVGDNFNGRRRMEAAFAFLEKEMLGPSNPRTYTPQDVMRVTSRMRVFWASYGPIVDKLANQKYYGLQNGLHIMLGWFGSVSETAFFHESCHVFDQIVHHVNDYRHEDKLWWSFCASMRKNFKEIECEQFTCSKWVEDD